ncbi:MAG: TldD/PmbA family protein [Sulfolobales archaeon]
MDEVINELIERGLRLSRKYGASEAELYGVKESITTVRGDKEGVKDSVAGDRLIVGVRVTIGKKVVTQGGIISRLNELDYIVERAVKVVKTLPEDSNWLSLPRKLSSSNTNLEIAQEIKYPDFNRIIDLNNYLVTRANELDKRVFVSDIHTHLVYFERFIANTYGEVLNEQGTRAFISASVKAIENGWESGYTEYYSGTSLTKFDPEHLIGKATEIAVKTLRAKRVQTGMYEVIMAPKVFKYVFEDLLIPAFCADNIQRNRSPLKGKLEHEVFSKELTVFDDGIQPSMSGTKGFDDEGVPTTRKCLIDKGVIKNHLYDNYTANIDRLKSTGNAFRSTPSNSPSPWRLNIIVDSGNEDLTTLIKTTRKGLIVYDVIGLWLSNPVNGLLNATVANGMLIEEGEERYPVKGVILSGNIYELLKQENFLLTANKENYGTYILPYAYLPKTSVAGL